ncbi:MAG: FAD-dependent oxidoreductase [Nannocystaceae bacterium]|nr:FAD-dependent oxidoreductase [Nannocystaceae bacterium]
MTTSQVPLAVIGGGLAGTLLVRALVSRGVDGLLWLGRTDPQSGSTVPCALVHPFVGRSFAPSPDLPEAWRVSSAWLATLPLSCGLHAAPMHRAAGDDATGERLRRSWQRHGETLREQFGPEFIVPPPVAERPRGFQYGPTFALDLPEAVRWSQEQLPVAPRDVGVTRLEAVGHRWRLHFDDSPPLTACEVVVCAGTGARHLLSEHAETEHLEHVEGRLVHHAAPPLSRFTIDRGHIASSATRVAWGSSFHSHDGPRKDNSTEQLRTIESRLLAHCPELPRLRDASVWRGVRVVDRYARRPWIDTLRPGLHVFSAFGSKGTLWIPLLAQRWAERWRHAA